MGSIPAGSKVKESSSDGESFSCQAASVNCGFHRAGEALGAEECGGRAVVLAEKWKRLIPRVRGMLDSLSGHNTD